MKNMSEKPINMRNNNKTVKTGRFLPVFYAFHIEINKINIVPLTASQLRATKSNNNTISIFSEQTIAN